MGPVLPERVWTLKTNWRPAARALVVAVFEPVESETIANQEESVLQDVRRIREHPRASARAAQYPDLWLRLRREERPAQGGG